MNPWTSWRFILVYASRWRPPHISPFPEPSPTVPRWRTGKDAGEVGAGRRRGGKVEGVWGLSSHVQWTQVAPAWCWISNMPDTSPATCIHAHPPFASLCLRNILRLPIRHHIPHTSPFPSPVPPGCRPPRRCVLLLAGQGTAVSGGQSGERSGAGQPVTIPSHLPPFNLHVLFPPHLILPTPSLGHQQ